MQHRRDGETPTPHSRHRRPISPPQKRSDGEGPGERPTKWRQPANKIPPHGKAANPRFAADRRRSPPKRKKRWEPPQPRAPARGYPQSAPSARKQNPSRKAKPTDFPFSMAFKIFDKKAMEKGQGMRPAAPLPPPRSNSHPHCLCNPPTKSPTQQSRQPQTVAAKAKKRWQPPILGLYSLAAHSRPRLPTDGIHTRQPSSSARTKNNSPSRDEASCPTRRGA